MDMKLELVPIGVTDVDRAKAFYTEALADVGLDDVRVGRVLHDYFAWATTTGMARYPDSADDVPDGLRVPQWSWEGLAG